MGNPLVDDVRDNLDNPKDGKCPQCGSNLFVVDMEPQSFTVTLSPEDSALDESCPQGIKEIRCGHCKATLWP